MSSPSCCEVESLVLPVLFFSSGRVPIPSTPPSAPCMLDDKVRAIAGVGSPCIQKWPLGHVAGLVRNPPPPLRAQQGTASNPNSWPEPVSRDLEHISLPASFWLCRSSFLFNKSSSDLRISKLSQSRERAWVRNFAGTGKWMCSFT